MKVGCMNNPRKDFIEELRLFHSYGLDYIDLTMEYPGASIEKVKKEEKEFTRLLKKFDMSVIGHMPWYLQITSPHKNVRKAFLNEASDVMELSAGLGAPHVTIHPDFLPLKRTVQEQKELLIDSLGQLLDKSQDLGIDLCFENFKKDHVSSLVLEDIFKELPGLKFTLDVGHGFIGVGNIEYIKDLISQFKDRLTHVHIHDNQGMEDDHLPLGVGQIDIPGVVDSLKNAGYNGSITLEVFAQDRDYMKLSMQKLNGMW